MFRVYIDDMRISSYDNSPLPDSGRFFLNGVLVTELVGNHLYNTIRALKNAGHIVTVHLWSVYESLQDYIEEHNVDEDYLDCSDIIGIGCV